MGMLPECHVQSVYCTLQNEQCVCNLSIAQCTMIQYTLHNEQWVQCIQYLIVQCVQYLIVYFAQLCNISLVIVPIVQCAFSSSCIVQKVCNVLRRTRCRP